MGAAQHLDIAGAKSGSSSAKTPVEASDSLRSTNLAKILIAVGEGEFEGTPSAADIYLDNTPINDASGNVNYPNVTWAWRNGAVDQSYIPGIPAVENETTINVELRSDTAWVRSITNLQLSAVRVRLAWAALQQQDDEGNVGGYRIEYAIDVATDGGAYQQVLDEAVDGKTTTRYERSRRIDLPAATSGWQIRVRRITPNQNSNKIADSMLVAGITEVIDAKLRYPNTALLYIEFDAEQFTNIPAVTVKCKARKWQVPSNYDPVARTYSGVWDGTMKEAWTNNAAWITYGICTVDRFGLGKRIKSWMVDKWELYRIAQYCDQLVPNGVGGTEPRYLCDMNIQAKADAWSLLRDISAIYRGMTYWAQGQLVAQADMPRAQDFDYVFTRANVIDGKFSYSSASSKTRYTRALVSYDNPANNYDTDVTAYADLVQQRRFGDKPVEISAIGCTRASEAQRRGKWVILSNNQDRTVSFTTGMEGRIPLPGYIIPVADSLLAGREIGGRISGAAGVVVTLDRDTQAKAGDRLIINLPSGKAEARTVASVAGRAVTVTTAYSEAPGAQLQWALDADDLSIPLYRVLTTKRTTEGDYEITALQYEPSKFDAIDTGARLEEKPISVIPITVVPAPASISFTSTSSIIQGLAVATMTVAWPAVIGAVAYDVEWRKDSGNWMKVARTGALNVDVTGIYAGGYVARVRAVSAFDISSIWRTSNLTQLAGKVGTPPAVTSLTATSQLFGIALAWTFPAGAEDTQRTEIWYGTSPSLDAAAKLSDLAYPQRDYVLQNLKAGATLYFWARLVDRIGNIGPFYPTENGVQGISSTDATLILEQIAGQITETQLGQDLLTKIDKIDEIDGLQEQIDNLSNPIMYKATDAYAIGAIVYQGDRLYQAIAAVPAKADGTNAPPNATYWKDVGQILTTANGLVTQVNQNTSDITAVSAQASSLQSLVASRRDDSASGDLADALNSWNSIASAAQEAKVRAEQDYAQAQVTTTLQAAVGDNAAKIVTVQQVVADGQTATAQQLAQLSSIVGDNAATVTTLTKTVADNQSATATSLQQLSTTVGSQGDTLGQQQTAITQTTSIVNDINGKLAATWSVKMQYSTSTGQYIAAGIGLGIENTAAGLQSQFLVSADRFAVVNTIAGGTPTVPFAVQGGQVFINNAIIQDLSLSFGKISDTLQSDNYVAGSQGWKLSKAGAFEINGVVAGGGRITLTNRALKVFDQNGVLRVQLGDLTA